MILLSEIRIFPVKSLRGAAHGQALVEQWGLAGDRRWLVTTPAGQFLTQREHPRMALITASVTAEGLLLSAAGQAPVVVPAPGAGDVVVTIWRDSVHARDAGEAAATFLSAALGLPCRLVHLADPAARKLRPDYAKGEESVSFADAFPLLLTSQASLADLNARLAAPIPMLRFRPNVVATGVPAWAEDTWRRIRIGGVVFRVDKPCDRCVMTTIDPETATRPNPVEPIRTLGRFRRDARGGVMFGQNMVPESQGVIHVGDMIEVLEVGAPNVQLVA